MKVKNYKIDKAIKSLSIYLRQTNHTENFILSKAVLVIPSGAFDKAKWVVNYFEPMPYAEGNHGFTYVIDLNNLGDSIAEVTNDYFSVHNVYRAIEIGDKYVENYAEITQAGLSYLLNISSESEEIWQLDYACKSENQNEILFLMLKVSVKANKVTFEEIERRRLNNKT